MLIIGGALVPSVVALVLARDRSERVWIGGALALSVLGSYALANRWFMDRVHALARVAKQVAGGDRTGVEELAREGGDLSSLAQSLSGMVEEAHRVSMEQESAAKTLDYYTSHDSLTHLPNRAMFVSHLEELIAESSNGKKPVALLLLDIDRFKEINNTLGHEHGDLLLREAGKRIREASGASNLVARLGGDEFAVLMRNIDGIQASSYAQRILASLEAPLLLNDIPIDVAASIGIAVFPDDGDRADLLIRHADVAMYSAKRTSTRLATYHAEQDSYSPRRLALVGDLRQALQNGELILHYQPQVSLRAGRLVGVEALVRWAHGKFGMLYPDAFINLAEQTGLIRPMTEWAIDTALEQCNTWQEQGLFMPSVAVNLSTKNIMDPELCAQVDRLLRYHKVEPRRLELEITEGAMVGDPTRSMENLKRLAELGVRLSIDDFGTGYSSLWRLRKLPVDTVKIDKSFVIGMTTNEDDAAIVHSVVDMGHNLGLSVIAEGVEVRESLNRLMALGCDSVQGYFIGRPAGPNDVVTWWKKSPYYPPTRTSERSRVSGRPNK